MIHRRSKRRASRAGLVNGFGEAPSFPPEAGVFSARRILHLYHRANGPHPVGPGTPRATLPRPLPVALASATKTRALESSANEAAVFGAGGFRAIASSGPIYRGRIRRTVVPLLWESLHSIVKLKILQCPAIFTALLLASSSSSSSSLEPRGRH
jgi:hypothetical protein